MNTISSSTGYSAASSSRGIPGLVSGMDTEDLVEKMLSGTQSKIDKQKAQKQTAQWRQDIYRDVISKIGKFNSKYFDFLSSSGTNLTSNTFFNQMKATTNSSAFRVTGSSNAISGNTSVQVHRLASSTRLEGKSIDDLSTLSGSFEPDAFESRVSFEVAAVMESKPKLDVDGNPILDADGNPVTEMVETREKAMFTLGSTEIDKLLNGETVEIEVPHKASDPTGPKDKFTFTVKDGNLTIANNERFATVQDRKDGGGANTSTSLGLDKLGLKAGSTTAQVIDLESPSLTNNKLVSRLNKEASVKFEVTLDNQKKSIELSKNDTLSSLQGKLDFAFGRNAIVVNDNAGSGDLSDFKLTTTAGRKIVVGGNGAGLDAMGMVAGKSNTVALGDSMENVFGSAAFDADGKASFSINGKTIEVLKEDTVSTMMSKINKSGADVNIQYTPLENRFVIGRSSSGAGFDLAITDDNGLLSKILGSAAPIDFSNINAVDGYQSGTNAEITVNGITTERSTNSFSINGLNFELLGTTEAGRTDTVTTTRDTETIFKGIKSFVDDYNALLKEMNELTGAKAEYKDYAPLTDAQKNEMTNSEIEAWEKKAKTGLMRGDSDINSFLSQMRIALYQKPEGAKYALYDIGIETTKDWESNGKLELNEDKLKEMINSDPLAIQELFTFSKTKEVTDEDGKKHTVFDGTQGLATMFKDIIKRTANTSSGSPGVLVEKAGVAGTATDKKNTLTEQMTRINDKLKLLTFQYDKEKTRYWRQFNDMERVLSQLSAQSGWLTQQMGG